jgi:hypothetical protein
MRVGLLMYISSLSLREEDTDQTTGNRQTTQMSKSERLMKIGPGRRLRLIDRAREAISILL